MCLNLSFAILHLAHRGADKALDLVRSVLQRREPLSCYERISNE